MLCHLCTKYYVIFRNYSKEEDIFSHCWLLKPLKESMFLWVQVILFVVAETTASISIIHTLRTATAGKVCLCCLFQGRILLPIQNEWIQKWNPAWKMKEGQRKGNIYGRLSILACYWLQGLHSLKIPGFVHQSAEQTEFN